VRAGVDGAATDCGSAGAARSIAANATPANRPAHAAYRPLEERFA